MTLQDHPFWKKLLLPRDAREIAEQIRSLSRFNMGLDTKGQTPFRAALIERLTPLLEQEAKEELERAVTKMDEVVDYWFTTAFGVYPRRKPALATTVPDPESPLGQQLAARLGKWKSVVEEATKASRPRGWHIEDENLRRIFNTRFINSRSEAQVAEALLNDEEFIEMEARRHFADEQLEGKIRARVDALRQALPRPTGAVEVQHLGF